MLTRPMIWTTLVFGAAALPGAAAPDVSDLRAGLVHGERILTVIPVERPVSAEQNSVRLADIADPEVRIGARGVGRPDRLFASYEGETPRLIVPGHVIENERRSFAVTGYAATRADRPVEIDLAVLSDDREHDTTRIAFRTLPPTLRWMALTQPNGGEIRESVGLWTRRWNTPDEEESLSDLRRARDMEWRVRGYVTPLRELRPSSEKRAIVGYVALLDGELALVEVLGSPDDFATHWPSALRALAIEAVLAERNEGWLETAIHVDHTPEEFGRDAVNTLLAALPKRAFETSRLGESLVLRAAGNSNWATRLVTTHDGSIVHAVHAPDATKRLAPVFDSVDPGDGRSLGRNTGDLDRVLDRRKAGDGE